MKENNLYDDAYFAYVIKTLVKQIPNDSELGKEVRSLFWKAKEEWETMI